MNKKFLKKFPKRYLLLLLVLPLGFWFVRLLSSQSSVIQEFNKPPATDFEAPGKDWPSDKKVEDYFVEHLRMTPQEARETRSRPGGDGKVMLRIREHTTLEGLLSNLEYYGFVRNKEALRYALGNTTDNQIGKANPIMVGNNTISTWSYYRISENMNTWEVADELLNHPTYFAYDEYNYMFMP